MHRFMLCWLVVMQALSSERKTWEELARWTPDSITVWRLSRLRKTTYWDVHLLVAWWVEEALQTLPFPKDGTRYLVGDGSVKSKRGDEKSFGPKVFGPIDYFSGRLFYKGHMGCFNSASYAAFLLDVLSQTRRHVVVIQDGARYHTSKAMQQFFDTHADRLTIEQLPAYSPDLNPIAHIYGRKSRRRQRI
jgi:hypothetical protein